MDYMYSLPTEAKENKLRELRITRDMAAERIEKGDAMRLRNAG